MLQMAYQHPQGLYCSDSMTYEVTLNWSLISMALASEFVRSPDTVNNVCKVLVSTSFCSSFTPETILRIRPPSRTSTDRKFSRRIAISIGQQFLLQCGTPPTTNRFCSAGTFELCLGLPAFPYKFKLDFFQKSNRGRAISKYPALCGRDSEFPKEVEKAHFSADGSQVCGKG
ncbi:hypothetical protein BJ508DRAFT_160985 [Ascobolus immersus RN42]|uniref:Uncharacterized protein n=1 Tax=Ascobolus immersus RN42 TaxID=1160509 RepID=A0A3N4I043_ASCIM|nr:hypothetical protein BJ508DRAFT_160985 [Ascobolus immersus RN42]